MKKQKVFEHNKRNHWSGMKRVEFNSSVFLFDESTNEKKKNESKPKDKYYTVSYFGAFYMQNNDYFQISDTK